MRRAERSKVEALSRDAQWSKIAKTWLKPHNVLTNYWFYLNIFLKKIYDSL